MSKKPLFWETFFLILIVGTLNGIANRFHLYWSVNEFDSLVHFLAGSTVAVFFLWLYFFSGFFAPPKRGLKNFIVISLLGTMFVGLTWEIFEFFLGEQIINKVEYPFDTTLDLVMDFLGSLAGCFYGYLREMKSEISSFKFQKFNE